MKRTDFIGIIFLVFFSVVLSCGAHGQEVKKEEIPGTIKELRQAILQVLEDTGTPAAGIALVEKDGPVWIEGLGKADVERNNDADEETMFRIASTSKIFVALAILKLQEEGKLSLKDRAVDLIPEIDFKNPWEETNPILIEHLIEHTTGWDDIHLAERIYDEPEAISLKKALDYHPHSRISKWIPGTRMAYANSGPAVAAYIVEKITGESYDDYMAKNFFSPMGMETMTFFPSKEYRRKGATLYNNGEPQDYWHILMWPSGAINASPVDMARMLQLFIRRGMTESTRLLTENSMKRMETPSTTLGAKAGLKYGYGLGLYTSNHNGFTYYKHGGSIGAGKSDFSYLPDHGLGYSVQINSGSSEAIRKISALIRSYQTQSLPQPVTKVPPLKSGQISHPPEGYYQIINPIKQLPYHLPSLLVERIWTGEDTVYNQIPAHFGKTVKFIPVDHGFYHNLLTGRTDFVVVNDPLKGEVLELAGTEGGTVTLGSVSGTIVFGRILVLFLWVLLIIWSFLTLPFWLYAYLKGVIPSGVNIRLRIWSLLPSLLLIIIFLLLAAGSLDGKQSLAQPSFISISIMVSSITFFISAILSLVMTVRYRKKAIRRSLYLPVMVLSFLHVLVAFYLLWHGAIGLMTWA